MRSHRIPPLVLLALLAAAPVAGQGIPDNIPDDPEESLADREQKRMIERYRSFLGRFFTGGTMAVAPLGPAYQLDLAVGYTLQNGDALALSAGARTVPPSRNGLSSDLGTNDGAWMIGFDYQLHGTRLLGTSPLGWRSALGLGAGVMRGTDLTAAFFQLKPSYALIARSSWSVPVGLTLSVATIDNRDPDASLTRAFLGVQLGVRWHLVRRDRLDTR
jgi:hypothetical protein